MEILRLYDFLPSGNGYKIRLLLTQMGMPFERVDGLVAAALTFLLVMLRTFRARGYVTRYS